MVPDAFERLSHRISFSVLRRAVMYTSVNEQAFALCPLLAVAPLHEFDTRVRLCTVKYNKQP
jgi:hypothetical protein